MYWLCAGLQTALGKVQLREQAWQEEEEEKVKEAQQKEEERQEKER